MTLTLLDWIVIAAYFLFNLGIGLYYARRARGSTTEFFLSGRNVPWWLAGTSMVATTFAADTPLVVTGLVAANGIAGNWLWWNFVMSGILTVFLYARLWRRAGVMTDVEFAELRYSGKPAAFLRGFRALYLGIPINCIVLGWVNLAMIKILQTVLNIDKGDAMLVIVGMLLFTAFAAAYMSTIGTQLNWGASYVINDFYRRFVKREGSERHYVIASQIVTMLLMVISLMVTLNLDTIGGAWKLLLVTGAGTGTVLLLRWFWWRINAWSEVSAMAVAAAVSLFLQLSFKWNSDDPKDFAYLMLVTVGITTVAWLAVTLLTRAEPREKLINFYRQVRPDGPGWKQVAAEAGLPAGETLLPQLVNWVLGCVLIYASLFGIGKLVLKEWMAGVVFVAAAILAGILISRNLSRVGWKSDAAHEPELHAKPGLEPAR